MKEYIMADYADDGQRIGDLTVIGELVRCKDCKHWSWSDDETYCEELGIFNTHHNSYCSWGKKKDD